MSLIFFPAEASCPAWDELEQAMVSVHSVVHGFVDFSKVSDGVFVFQNKIHWFLDWVYFYYMETTWEVFWQMQDDHCDQCCFWFYSFIFKRLIWNICRLIDTKEQIKKKKKKLDACRSIKSSCWTFKGLLCLTNKSCISKNLSQPLVTV